MIQAEVIAQVSTSEPPPPRAEDASPTLWGLSVQELHDAYWHARGVQCVRRRQSLPLQRSAELFLLIEPDQLVLFDISEISDRLTWHNALVTRLRLIDRLEQRYSERVVLDDRGFVQRIERRYRPQERGSSRIILTSSRRLARLWMNSETRRGGWDRLRRSVSWPRVDHWKCEGRTYLASKARQARELLDELVERWPTPEQSIEGLEELDRGVWHLKGDRPPQEVVCVGPLWLGRGVSASRRQCLVGPHWVGDNGWSGSSPPPRATVRPIGEVEMALPGERSAPRRRAMLNAVAKRVLDLLGAGAALILLMPPMVVAGVLIFLEDGGPVFFGHVRQGREGRLFRCWKFRTMHRDAEPIARELDAYNRCDGPQVFILDDPRVTRIGRYLRATHFDEVPQFVNVLLGQMSLVGPRPSPDAENQYCPAWRDSRLSVRPGITGLWQLNRTREPGEDFQEWIKYDIGYVQHASVWLDVKILVKTAWMLVHGRHERGDG